MYHKINITGSQNINAMGNHCVAYHGQSLVALEEPLPVSFL
jgi:hypothetical protein